MPGSSSSANDEWIRHDFCAGGLVGLNWRTTRRVSVHGPWSLGGGGVEAQWKIYGMLMMAG